MPFEKGRVKTGGRKAGVPDKVKLSLTVIEMLDQLGHNPIERMVSIAENTENPIEVRAKMESELASYGWAKRKSVEHSGTANQINTSIDLRNSILAATADLPQEVRAILAQRLIGTTNGSTG